jgi:hypothetical protein
VGCRVALLDKVGVIVGVWVGAAVKVCWTTNCNLVASRVGLDASAEVLGVQNFSIITMPNRTPVIKINHGILGLSSLGIGLAIGSTPGSASSYLDLISGMDYPTKSLINMGSKLFR